MMRSIFASLVLATGVLFSIGAQAQFQPVIPLCGQPAAPCTVLNPFPVIPGTGSLTDVNLTEVAGAAVKTGAGTAAGSIRVELPTDGTGKVGLNAGSAIIGKVGIDQTTPGTTNAVSTTNWPTTVDTNSGVKSASTPRVVIATDQPNLTTPLNINTAQVNGITISTGAGATGTGTQRVGVAQDATTIAGSAPGTAGTASANVVTIQGIASMTKLLVTPDTNTSFNLGQVGGTNTVNGGLAGTLGVGGATATNVAITDNPLNNGAQAVSSENSAVTTARKVQLVADLVGKLITLPYANPENSVYGVTAAITDTTSTSTIASAGGSLRNYVTQCTVTNSHATVGTFVKVLDGTNIFWEPYAAAAGGGANTTFPVAIRGTAATAVNCQPVTTGANVICSCSGYKGV